MHTWMGKVCFFPFELEKQTDAEKKRPNQLVLFASFFFSHFISSRKKEKSGHWHVIAVLHT